MNSKNLFNIFLSLLIIIMIPLSSSGADDNTYLYQAYVHKQYMDIFVNKTLDTENLSVKTSTETSKVVDSGSITDKNITVYTTLLVDISTSVPYVTRPKVIEFINYSIENINKNEQIRIITFGEELNILQDYTSDRFDLSKAASQIEFNAEQSMIFDAAYNSIPEIKSIDDEPCYYHTVIITDGIDLTQTGVTKEELYLKLQSETYPIDVAAVSSTKQSEPEKELSALVRISNGRYTNIHPESNADEVSLDLSTDDFFWLRTEIPSLLLDGSIRQVDISDGNYSLQFDIKIPVYDVPVSAITETAETTAVTTTTAKVETSESTVPQIIPEESEKREETFIQLLSQNIPLIIITVIIIAALVIVFLFTRSKKAYLNTSDNPRNGESETTAADPESETVLMNHVIRFIDIDDPGQTWDVNVNKEIIVGRSKDADIRFDEETVARRQCKITRHDKNFMVINLSQSNKTYLNDVKVNDTSGLQIESGSVLKFGSKKLRIDINNNDDDDENKTVSMSDDKTVSMSGNNGDETVSMSDDNTVSM